MRVAEPLAKRAANPCPVSTLLGRTGAPVTRITLPGKMFDVYGVELGWIDPLSIGINVGIIQSLNFEDLCSSTAGRPWLHYFARYSLQLSAR